MVSLSTHVRRIGWERKRLERESYLEGRYVNLTCFLFPQTRDGTFLPFLYYFLLSRLFFPRNHCISIVADQERKQLVVTWGGGGLSLEGGEVEQRPYEEKKEEEEASPGRRNREERIPPTVRG